MSFTSRTLVVTAWDDKSVYAMTVDFCDDPKLMSNPSDWIVSPELTREESERLHEIHRRFPYLTPLQVVRHVPAVIAPCKHLDCLISLSEGLEMARACNSRPE